MLVEHNLKFVTEFDETHPIVNQVKVMPHSELVLMLEGMLKELIAPELGPILAKINERGTYAILKVAE